MSINGVIPLIFCCAVLQAGPLEFGKAELNAALAEKNIAATTLHLITEVSTDAPEAFRIENGRIYGGDLRGLMYGMLEAAAQIRANGRLSNMKAAPATPIRGIRVFVHNAQFEKQHTREYWTSYIEMLARNRFNRFNLVFAHQTDYLAPPYPFWISLKNFPEVKARGVTPERQAENLAMLQFISRTAADHGIDFTLGIWEHNIQTSMQPSVDGLTRENIGPYSYEALKAVLAACPAIRSVQMRTNSESGIPNEQQVSFYRDWVFRAIHDANHRVSLDLRGWAMNPGLIDAAKNAGVPLRLSSKYWAEDLGRPYQPAETWPGYSYLNFLERPRAYQFYWELWGLGSHRLLLWGDPEYVRRAVPTFTMSDTAGFEIDPPLAQKGFGNGPGDWAVFPAAAKYEFERYWMFYTLWGRLSYDPKTPDKVWMDELHRRFGAAAEDVMEAYRSASGVLNEIVAAHLADPNMYIWPEINPGGLIESYREVRPSDWRFIASVPEAVHNRIAGIASAKQTPRMTAERLHAFSLATDQAVERARKAVDATGKEWQATESDLSVLASLGEYHARKQMAADQLTYFYATCDVTGLQAARRELVGAKRSWDRIVKLTDGVYPANMSFGPEDTGQWKDKVAYVDEDLKLADERMNVYQKFGCFDYGFDFGGPVMAAGSSYRNTGYVLRNTVEPRFQAINPKSVYSEQVGYGWVSPHGLEVVELPLTPYLVVRGVAKNPKQFPANVLFGDSIRGSGPQVFRVKVPDGNYTVAFLHPDESTREVNLAARRGILDIVFPAGDWNVSGLVVKAAGKEAHFDTERWPISVPRPKIEHTPPAFVAAGQPLVLTLKISPEKNVRSVRLHYRAVNQLAKFKMIESSPGHLNFTIPADDVSAKWDLMYYFEVLNVENTGWFFPDPLVTTPYFMVRVK